MSDDTSTGDTNRRDVSFWKVFDGIVVAAFVLVGLVIFAQNAYQILTVDPFGDYLEMAVILMGMTVGMMAVVMAFILRDINALKIGEEST